METDTQMTFNFIFKKLSIFEQRYCEFDFNETLNVAVTTINVTANSSFYDVINIVLIRQICFGTVNTVLLMSSQSM